MDFTFDIYILTLYSVRTPRIRVRLIKHYRQLTKLYIVSIVVYYKPVAFLGSWISTPRANDIENKPCG